MSDLNDHDEATNRFWRKDNPLVYGIAVTGVVIFAYIVLGVQSECIATVCETNFQKFLGSDPNEMGDTLAGLFGALAFIWIIVTVLLQSQELREQRKEFREQRIATEKLAAEAGIQSSILTEQFERSEKLQNDEFVKELLKDAFILVRILRHSEWYADERQASPHLVNLNTTFLDTDSWDVKLLDAANAFDNVERIRWSCNSGEIIPNREKDSKVVRLVEILDQVSDKEKSLSEIFRLKLRRARFEEFRKSARVLAEDPSFWYTPEKTETQ